MLIQTKRLGIGSWKNKKLVYTANSALEELERLIKDEYYNPIDLRIKLNTTVYFNLPEFLHYCIKYKVLSKEEPIYKNLYNYCYKRKQ